MTFSNKLKTLVVSLALFSSSLFADEITLQQGKDGYNGVTDTYMKSQVTDESLANKNFSTEEIIETAD